MTCARQGCSNETKRNRRFCSHACGNLHVAAVKRAPAPQNPNIDERGDLREITQGVNCEITSLEQLIAFCKIDTETWEVERWVCNKWEMGAKDAQKNIKVTPLFQIKAWLRRKVAVIAARQEIAELKELAKQVAARSVGLRRIRPANTNGNLLEINIADLHVGKLAWGRETGYENYDARIAERLHDQAIETLLSRAGADRDFPYERILLVVGNDLLHSDTKAGTTTKGTPLDNDGRFHKTFARVRTMIVRAIERLREVAPVTVLVVPGNHDTLATWHLGDSLECFYHRTPDVEVLNEPCPRKYYQHGQVMLMFAHGNLGKLADYPLQMATEKPEMWASSRFREAHTGDKHQEKVIEVRGVKVRILPALCPPDAWHAEQFYTGNQRVAEAFVWNRQEGLIATLYFTAPSAASEEAVAATAA